MAISGLLTLILNMMCIVEVTDLRLKIVSWFVCPCVAALASTMLVYFLFEKVSGSLTTVAAMLTAVIPAVLLYILLLRAMGIKHTELFFFRKNAGLKKRKQTHYTGA